MTQLRQPGESGQAAGDQRRVWAGGGLEAGSSASGCPGLSGLIAAPAGSRQGLHLTSVPGRSLCAGLPSTPAASGVGRGWLAVGRENVDLPFQGRSDCSHIGADPTASRRGMAGKDQWDHLSLSDAGGQQRPTLAGRALGSPPW